MKYLTQERHGNDHVFVSTYGGERRVYLRCVDYYSETQQNARRFLAKQVAALIGPVPWEPK